MARPLRLELAGGVYHVTSRGDRREDIFLTDDDRRAWLKLLGDVCKRFNWVCHGWCQMTNHYHVVLETVEANLSQGMRHLNGVYTQYANRAHGRVGHVFQGRYKAILVEKEAYLLELARCVVLNPVRANMVADTADWPWSSYHCMTGETPTPPWLQTDALLERFGLRRDQAVMRFIDFVRAGVDQPPLWDKLRGQIYLGDDVFLEKMSALVNDTIKEVPLTQRRPLAQDLYSFTQQPGDRDDAMAQAFATGAFTMRAIADAFGVHYATVSRAVRKQGTHR
jgi:REP element-mobilizing transposase RayT